VYAGALFREEAARRGVSLPELNVASLEDPSIDRQIDDHQVALLRQGGVILEGRLAGWLAHNNRLPAFKVWVVCDPDECVRRLVQRDGADETEQRLLMDERVARETERYRRHYGADPLDLSIYDLVLDSTSTAPDELVKQVLQRSTNA
jgi:cytidylate kinase